MPMMLLPLEEARSLSRRYAWCGEIGGDWLWVIEAMLGKLGRPGALVAGMCPCGCAMERP